MVVNPSISSYFPLFPYCPPFFTPAFSSFPFTITLSLYRAISIQIYSKSTTTKKSVRRVKGRKKGILKTRLHNLTVAYILLSSIYIRFIVNVNCDAVIFFVRKKKGRIKIKEKCEFIAFDHLSKLLFVRPTHSLHSS